MHKTVWSAIALHTLLVLLALILGPMLLQQGESSPPDRAGALPSTLGRLVQWDAKWYVQIAAQGYDQPADAAFFPMLPLLIYALSLGGLVNPWIVGLGVCNLFTVGLFYMLARLGSMVWGRPAASRAVFALALMPTSLFLNSIYTEPLFLFFILTSLVAARQERWWLAGIAGACAAATRNLGLAMTAVLVVDAWLIYRRPCRAMLAGLLVPLGLIAYVAYLYAVRGDALAFLHAQESWERFFQWPWLSFKSSAAHLLSHVKNNEFLLAIREAQDLGFTLTWIGLLLVALLWRKSDVPASWQLLSWLLLLTPLTSSHAYYPLFSMSRFVLVIPVGYFIIARLPRPAYLTTLVIGAALLLLNLMMFCTGHFVG